MTNNQQKTRILQVCFCLSLTTVAYLWASLVAEIVKNLPAIQGTQVQSLGWEDPLEKEMATHSGILLGEFRE